MSHVPTVLLVQPPIHDFTAFDLFVYPLGLLEAAVRFEAAGFRCVLVDALDRGFDTPPGSGDGEAHLKKPTFRQDGCGHFHRQRAPAPPALEGIPRRFHRFGIPAEELKKALAAAGRAAETGRPDLVGITCTMTYWYPGVSETADLAREVFGDVPVVLGGVYATLCPDHARENAGVDAIVVGDDPGPALSALGFYLPQVRPCDRAPAHHLVGTRETAAVRAGRGCPYRCTYCAAHRLSGALRKRPAGEVLDELVFLIEEQGRRHIAFHDDALIAASAGTASGEIAGSNDETFLELAGGIVERGLHAAARFYAINGINASAVTPAVARALKAAGFSTLRIGFESADSGIQIDTGGKVTADDLATAVDRLLGAGFEPSDLGIYIMAGLPGQEADTVFETIRFVHGLGAPAHITEYAPVPGTPAFEESRRFSRLDLGEPLNHGKCLAPFRFPTLTPEILHAIKDAAHAGNRLLRLL